VNRVAARAAELVADRVPFVQATVVRAECPTSARPGDAAIVTAGGVVEGFVGGQCAEASVRVAALEVLDRGEALLLRILPEGGTELPESPGARTVVNPCLSGGALEVFLEPRLPAPVLRIVGATPIAGALAGLARPLGYDVRADPAGPGDPAGATAVVVCSHGRHEPEAIRAALDAGVGFIGLVASRVRGRAVLDAMGLTDGERARVRTPVGLDLGARTAEEVALSIMAEVVRAVRVEGLRPAPAGPGPARPAEAVDPVCGMTVVVGPGTPHLRVGGEDRWFCNPGCRARHAEELGVA
jgi:xanthine dehydrogenase accessory factor